MHMHMHMCMCMCMQMCMCMEMLCMCMHMPCARPRLPHRPLRRQGLFVRVKKLLGDLEHAELLVASEDLVVL